MGTKQNQVAGATNALAGLRGAQGGAASSAVRTSHRGSPAAAPARTLVWSCGGGTQSAAIAALIIQGRLPKPDIAVIADTEREKQATWDYLDAVLRPQMAAAGVTIERVRKSDFAKEDLWEDWGESGKPQLLIPAYVLGSGGGSTEGLLKTLCSSRWKRRVVQRWLKGQGITQAAVWLGMSRDELSRVRQSGEQWYEHRYPLVFDVPMRRGECLYLVADIMKWPEPPRSSCWMCPNHDDREWERIRSDFPADFARAVQFEREIQQQRPDFYLHRSCQPIDQVAFDSQQTTLQLSGCESGYCFS